MKYLGSKWILALSVFSFALSCSEEKESAQPNHSQEGSQEVISHVPSPEDLNPTIEGDFGGFVRIDSSGHCYIVDGHDVNFVKCFLFYNENLKPQIQIDFSVLNLENPPICSVQFVGDVNASEKVTSIDKNQMTLGISESKVIEIPVPQYDPCPEPHTHPCDPCCDPCPQPCDPCCKQQNPCGPVIIQSCGKSQMTQRLSSESFPNQLMFQCKITG